ncbi:MAG: peptidoglycan DD-metalloendopeptidase family protein [Alphaproteobacteria bacterium]|nr:peptidoglycan DD-metalloendopeptidase family protein [Alphaproteobacteria bacterium]
MKQPSALVLAMTLALPVAAETAPARSPDDLLRLQEQIAETEKQKALDQAGKVKAAAELSQLQAEAASLASQIQTAERSLTQAERRIGELDTREKTLSADLEKRRAGMGPLLAALQRLTRDPPPALAVSPDDASKAARGAMLIAAVTEKLNVEAQKIAATLKELGETRAALVVERDAARTQEAALTQRTGELKGLVAKRQALVQELDDGVTAAEGRIAALQARAADMTDLMAWLDEPPKPRDRAGATAEEANSAPVMVASRGAKVAFTTRRGKLPWPAMGDIARRFGEAEDNGATAQGLTLRTRADAQITAPADGEIVFAGPFGDYGRLLILAPSEGYFVLIGGFGRLDATVGQYVLAGEPLGTTAGSEQKNGPLLYIELRREGAPVDPMAWFVPVQANG